MTNTNFVHSVLNGTKFKNVFSKLATFSSASDKIFALANPTWIRFLARIEIHIQIYIPHLSKYQGATNCLYMDLNGKRISHFYITLPEVHRNPKQKLFLNSRAFWDYVSHLSIFIHLDKYLDSAQDICILDKWPFHDTLNEDILPQNQILMQGYKSAILAIFKMAKPC